MTMYKPKIIYSPGNEYYCLYNAAPNAPKINDRNTLKLKPNTSEQRMLIKAAMRLMKST